MKELSLTKSATNKEICNALKSLSRDQYSKKVDNAYAQDVSDMIARSSMRHQSDYKPYEEILYESMVEKDNAAWKKATRSGTAKEFYEYLLGDHLKFMGGDSARLDKTDTRIKNRQRAMQELGISFDPNTATPPSIFLNTNKKMGTAYSFELSVEEDKNYFFHEGEEIHGVSTCLNVGLVSQCYADGVCTEKDYKRHGSGTIKGCVILDVYKTFLGAVVSSKVDEDLCTRFEKYINAKTGHNTEAWVHSPYGYKQCALHYSREELNRIFSK